MVDLLSIYTMVKNRIGGEDRPLIEEILKSIQESSKPFLYLVEAPTGYGKTSISITCAIYSIFDSTYFPKVVHVLPLRSIVEDVLCRASKIIGEAVKAKMMDVKEEELEVFHLYPLNITTVDTFTWDIMKLNTKKISEIKAEREFGYDFLTQGSLLDSLIIFDEAHYILEDRNMKRVYSTVLKLLLEYKTPILILTATLSKGYREYFEHISKQYAYEFKVFKPGDSDPYILREKEKQFNIQVVEDKGNICENVMNLVRKDKVNLVVVNSPYTAVTIYEEMASKIDLPILLLHGNMKKSHREKVLEEIRRVSENKQPSIIVATQVIEAGVDLTSDVLITELATAQSLIQRMGRVARYSERSADIFILKSEGLPYPEDKIEKTWEWLVRNKDLIHPRLPSSYGSWIDQVHGKTISEVDPERFFSTLRILLSKLIDLESRSADILPVVEKIITDEPLLRDYTIPVRVEDEYLLFSPREVMKMFKKKVVKININGRELDICSDFTKLAIDMALGKTSIEVTYLESYDKIRGVLP
ncbi:MAG: CRISPR-associated helicase Cas3' [bacterium]|nr:CRISPR-associated helicase Cas3' [bacterium]MDW7986992.1 CRISPR-associated helicase Cas3' [Nitrososphaerota archaeon]